jgi:hypothetical protein
MDVTASLTVEEGSVLFGASLPGIRLRVRELVLRNRRTVK